MLTPQQIHKLTFRGAIWTLLLGSGLGLMGIWMDNFWTYDFAGKLLSTTWLLFLTCLLGAAITKWLVKVDDVSED